MGGFFFLYLIINDRSINQITYIGNLNINCTQYLTNYTDPISSKFTWKFSPKIDRINFYPDNVNDTTNFNSATFRIVLSEPPSGGQFIGIGIYDPGND